MLNQLTTNNELLNQMEKLAKEGGAESLIAGFSLEGILLGLFFSIVGLAFFRYGKKNGPLSTMLYGLVLMVFPYFVTDSVNIVLIGILFCVMPFILPFG